VKVVLLTQTWRFRGARNALDTFGGYSCAGALPAVSESENAVNDKLFQ
jgi:hypothetical protein